MTTQTTGAKAASKSRDAARTRGEILRAAALAFSRRGYAQTGVREIGAAAGINQALVKRYFGSKQGLFAAALHEALPLDFLFAGGRENFGRHVVSMLTSADEDAIAVVAMMILATADADAKAIVQRALDEDVLKPLSAWIGGPDAETRAALITIVCTGLTIYRRLLPLAPLAGEGDPAARAWLARALQEIAAAWPPAPDAR